MNRTWADTVTLLCERTERHPDRWWFASSFPWPRNLVERELEAGVKRGEVERQVRPDDPGETPGYRYVTGYRWQPREAR